MKLSISNIAWDNQNDERVYKYISSRGYCGLEISPTRFVGDDPYLKTAAAVKESRRLYDNYGLNVCSMQSIWYGKSEMLFSDAKQRNILFDYTLRALEFSEAIGCSNLVFGSPKNRAIPYSVPYYEAERIALDFFSRLSDAAESHRAKIALEANPVCYNTNFLNTTAQALTFCKKLSCPGISVNLDTGACLFNGESADYTAEEQMLFSHIHISRPMLFPVTDNAFDKKIAELDIDGYCSIEMKNTGNIDDVYSAVDYVRGVMYDT